MSEESNLAAAAESMAAGLDASLGADGGAATGDGGGMPPNKLENDKKERNLDLILDIPLRVTVELGRTKMLVRDLLQLGQGSVIELSKLAGEPMEILVNEKLVAKGEAVVVNEKFGVRLTDIISPLERVEQLK